ncbi:LPXTG cell wall anchor domain-containing protein [Facklamia miroungae]|uniref:LPXTG-motif cell wall anchor domain-containing protein n=1 Tax=Facklamia miroungae TaxID=120956 RepID=A0A1G7UN79_9LACT|nr:LPXTG cell wall anchor domain-containing protein [Facklamia miroungae]NKZ30195.1 LPXTG cell wall anchor domain-containing protein [Facklamia miroungae]SDG48808.1 LPXTG-motif cell wall anchor domain-containing protein [Facklamia miroungae]
MLPQTGEMATWFLIVIAAIALIGGLALIVKGNKKKH